MAEKANAHASSSKHTSSSKKDRSHKHHSKSKHIDDAAATTVKSKSRDKEKEREKEKAGPFESRLSSLRLSVPPKYAGDWLVGVKEVLDGMIMRHVPQMSGVLLAHWEHELLDDTVELIGECPFGVCEVAFRSIVWAPRIGQKLYGSHSLSSPSHLSLLFAKTFNISIPLQHIPQDLYTFEASDPADLPSEDEADDSDSEEESIVGRGGEGGGVGETGRWKRKKDGKLLGEGGKGIKFTVIGMQVTNNMLSLTGSLLSDPSNPPPPPSPILAPRPASASPSPSPSPEPEAEPEQAEADTADRPEIAFEFLSAREQKKARKDAEKAKREARKAKKAEKGLVQLEVAGAGDLVGRGGDGGEAAGKKRKDRDGTEGGKKKRRKDGE